MTLFTVSTAPQIQRSSPASSEQAGARRWLCAAAVGVVLLASFLLDLRHLGHADVTPWDEVFHATVARNLLRHPLTPTLVDRPFLPFNYMDWRSDHIWLHKPPMGLWQVSVSYALFGVNTLALRLPSAILSAAAAGLTYLIGAELLNRTAGLIAATLQAFNPVMLRLAHGYLFGDHVDIALLFWTELGVWFLARAVRTGHRRDLICCGIAQGLAFLSKTYPALVVTGLAGLAWALPLLGLARPPRQPIRFRSVLLIAAVTAVTALPWVLWTAWQFPREFQLENTVILLHLSRSVEGWSGPWDRVLFSYWIAVFQVYYPAALVALLSLSWYGLRRRRFGVLLVVGWALGALVPHLLATSKTPSATLIGWPAVWLLLGYLIAGALEGRTWSLGAWVTTVVLATFFLKWSAIPRDIDKGPAAAGAILARHLWVVRHVVIAAAVGGVFWFGRNGIGARSKRAVVCVAMAATVWLALPWASASYLRQAWAVTNTVADHPAFTGVARAARTLPTNAAIIVDERSDLESTLVAYAADRTCYPMADHDWQPTAAALASAGAVPYVLSPDALPLPVVFVDAESRRTLYRCP